MVVGGGAPVVLSLSVDSGGQRAAYTHTYTHGGCVHPSESPQASALHFGVCEGLSELRAEAAIIDVFGAMELERAQYILNTSMPRSQRFTSRLSDTRREKQCCEIV